MFSSFSNWDRRGRLDRNETGPEMKSKSSSLELLELLELLLLLDSLDDSALNKCPNDLVTGLTLL